MIPLPTTPPDPPTGYTCAKWGDDFLGYYGDRCPICGRCEPVESAYTEADAEADNQDRHADERYERERVEG